MTTRSTAAPTSSTAAATPAPAKQPPPSSSLAAQDIADQFAVSQSATMYLDQALDDTTRQALLHDQHLHSELCFVRAADAVRKATDEELAAAV
jgi:hypothetical protein